VNSSLNLWYTLYRRNLWSVIFANRKCPTLILVQGALSLLIVKILNPSPMKRMIPTRSVMTAGLKPVGSIILAAIWNAVHAAKDSLSVAGVWKEMKEMWKMNEEDEDGKASRSRD
jgi:hypothetical protein